MDYDSTDTNWEKVGTGLQKYLSIMKLVKNTNIRTNAEFQKRFNGFYRIRQRPRLFYDLLYEYLEANKNRTVSFEQTLNFFYQKLGRFEPSFSSKIVATINPNYPVWDSAVLRNLNLKIPGYNLDKKIRFTKIVKTYDNIMGWYSDFLKTKQAQDMIWLFDNNMGDTNITDIKKIDLILWQTRV